MTRILITDDPDYSTHIEVERADDGEINVWAVTDEDDRPTRRTQIGFPRELAVDVARAVLAAAGENGR